MIAWLSEKIVEDFTPEHSVSGADSAREDEQSKIQEVFLVGRA